MVGCSNVRIVCSAIVAMALVAARGMPQNPNVTDVIAEERQSSEAKETSLGASPVQDSSLAPAIWASFYSFGNPALD